MITGKKLSAFENKFFVGELSDCARQRVISAIGINSIETLKYQSHEITGAFVTDTLARRICAYCRKKGELRKIRSREPLPFRFFTYNERELTEITDRFHIFSLIGFQPKQSKEASGGTKREIRQKSPALA